MTGSEMPMRLHTARPAPNGDANLCGVCGHPIRYFLYEKHVHVATGMIVGLPYEPAP